MDRSPTIGYASDNKNGESNSSPVICREKKKYRSWDEIQIGEEGGEIFEHSTLPKSMVTRLEARAEKRLDASSVDLIIKASQVRRIDAFGLANCGVVNNRDDPAWCCSSPPTVAEKGGRRVVDESGGGEGGSVGKRVECSLNKQIPKRTHYLRLYRVAGYAADA